MSDIPIIVICYNTLHFISNFMKQLERFPNPVVLVDNASTYPQLLEYYDKIQQEWGDRLTIHRLDKNYGHWVYMTRSELFPDIYVLSDPDLELNPKMPVDVVTRLLELSRLHHSRKIGLALDISQPELFVTNPNYYMEKNIQEWESQFWSHRCEHTDYELYFADIDTTFCLYHKHNTGPCIRVAGDFMAKHLPWYKDYIKNHIGEEEMMHWKSNNICSTIITTLENT